MICFYFRMLFAVSPIFCFIFKGPKICSKLNPISMNRWEVSQSIISLNRVYYFQRGFPQTLISFYQTSDKRVHWCLLIKHWGQDFFCPHQISHTEIKSKLSYCFRINLNFIFQFKTSQEVYFGFYAAHFWHHLSWNI